MKIFEKLKALLALLTVVVLIGIMFAGCKKEEEAPAVEEAEVSKEGGTFRVYIHEPVSLDPPNSHESEGIQVIRQVFEGLVKYDTETLETVPAVAESWDISDDGLVYTFYLKKGVNFHSGREVVASDFAYAWSRLTLQETASYLAYHAEPIVGYDECQEGKVDTLAGVKALDDYTLEVTLKYPYGDFIKTLGHVCFFPVAKEDIEKWGDEYADHINGNGPFKFVEWVHDQHITLERNDDYWGDKAHLDDVKYVIMADENAAFLEYKAGNLEYTSIPQGKVKATEEDPKWKDYIIVKPLLVVLYFGMNVTTEPFKDNLALREAINYVIDRQNISDAIYEGVYVPATGIVSPGIKGFQENAMEFTYDPEKAKEKLAEAGYPNGEGLPTLIMGSNLGPGPEKVMEAVQADAKEIGINIEIETMEWVTALEKFQKGEVNFFAIGWGADYPTMDNFLYPLFYSKSADNYTKYNNPKIDQMLLEARKTQDEEERIVIYREVEKIILEDSAFAPVLFPASRRIVQPYVKGFYLSAMEEYDLSKVWLEKE